jgi:tRNA nucleotidyltransferase/poly(A) polymerase
MRKSFSPTYHDIQHQIDDIYPLLNLLLILRDIPCELYLYGGFLRDMVLEKRPKEGDFLLVNNMPTKDFEIVVEKILGARGFIVLGKISKSTGTNYHYLPSKDSSLDSVIDINLAQTIENKDYDFTINSLSFNLTTRKLADVYGALPDLDNKILRTVSNPQVAFSRKPLLIFRVIKCVCQLDLHIEQSTENALGQKSHHARETLEYVANNPNTLLSEWMLDNIFRGMKYNPERYFELCESLGIIEVFLSFIAEKFTLNMSSKHTPSPIFKNTGLGIYEYNLSVFLSFLINHTDAPHKKALFEKLKEILGIRTLYKFHPVGIDADTISYVN